MSEVTRYDFYGCRETNNDAGDYVDYGAYAALEQERDRLKDLVDWYKSLLGFHGHSLDDQISNSGKHIVDAIRALESALGGEGRKG